MKIETKKSEYSIRVRSPKKFDKRSIRTKVTKKKGLNIIVGCPKGKYDASKEKCKVGMKPQAFRFKKKRFDKDDVRAFGKRHRL